MGVISRLERGQKPNAFAWILIAIVTIVCLGVFVSFLMRQSIRQPQACTYDGSTIAYFKVPSPDGKKFRKVFPNEKEFRNLFLGGDYCKTRITRTQSGEDG